MIFIDLDREEPVALALEREPSRSLFIIDIRGQTQLGTFPLPEGYCDSGALILHKLRIVMLRAVMGDRLCAVNYSGQKLWCSDWLDGSRDPIRDIVVEQGCRRVWVSQLLKGIALDPVDGTRGQTISSESIHCTSDGQYFVVRGAALFRNTELDLDDSNFKRCSKLIDVGMVAIASGGGKLLLNSIKRACLVDAQDYDVTKVAHGMVGHWQTPHYVEEMRAFVTVGFVDAAMGFIVINLEGTVRLGPLTEEGLIVGVVRLGSGCFALMETGRLIELSEAMFEPG
jgi:hypothetical protein